MTNEMHTAISEAISELSQPYGDKRIHYLQLEIAELEDRSCHLSGTVLDQETLIAITRALQERFPSISFKSDGLRMLRGREGFATVSTNVAGLYAEPSFASEMISQLVGGTVVELLQEEGRWCFTRQADGYLGWVYAPYLDAGMAAEPSHVVAMPVALLRESPNAGAPLAGRIVAGTLLAPRAIEGDWAYVTQGVQRAGWLPLQALRALDALPRDEAERRAQMVRDAMNYTGVPYLWGGTTAFGFDCSGFVQMLHRLAGATIPRDADMQLAAGQAVEPPFKPGDLLFFGSKGGHRNITHVGMSTSGWQMVHASRLRNGVYVDDVQAEAWLRDIYVGACTFC